MRPIRSVVAFVLMSVLVWALYVSIFVYQLGAHTAAEYWLYSAQVVKTHLLRNHVDSRKVLFVGGSNVWMGIDAGMAGQALGTQSINLGLHAMLPLDQILEGVRPVLKAGDTVVLMLEYEYYVIDTPYNAWFLNQIMVGQPDWFWRLPWDSKLRFIAAVPPLRILEGTMTALFADRLSILRKRQVEQDPAKLLALMQSGWPPPSLPDTNFTFRNIDEDGDAIVAKGSFTSYIYPLDRAVLARHYPWETLADFARYCADRHVTLYLGWPPVVKGSLTFDSRIARRNMHTIMRRLAEAGIPVLGHPADFAYEHRLFADSGYHLTHEGRALQTQNVLRLLREKIDSRPAALP